MKCPRCKKNEARRHPEFGILPCLSCQNEQQVNLGKPPEFYSATKAARIKEDRDRSARDMIQPWDSKGKPNPEFVKAFPAHAKEYFTPEQLKKM